MRKSRKLAPGEVSSHPDLKWSDVKAEDVGSGFKVATFDEQPQDMVVATDPLSLLDRLKSLQQHGQPRESRFIHGESRFISYVFKPKPKRKGPLPKAKPLGAEKPPPQQTAKFKADLSANIRSVSDFYLNELSPKTLALATSMDRVKNITSQWIDEPIDLPVRFIQQKAERALQMRIVRHVCDYFDLTQEERQLMLSEFDHRLRI